MADSILLNHLVYLYGEPIGQAGFDRLNALIERWRPLIPAPRTTSLTERDALLITYGDQVQSLGTPPLRVLADFCNQHLSGTVSGIHILPFYPWTSDDGFSVKDYRSVDPALGGWDDMGRIGQRFRLMFDGVINHISAQSDWFQSFLRDDPKYRDYFIIVEGNPDLSQVVRPRALPLLTTFSTASGPKAVWTTFSDDQIDLNFQNPDVLLEIIDLLLFYISHGAEFIRLDAIAYLWKEIGTSCIHRPQTHHIIQLFRAVLDEVAPQVMLITETNVPHVDNISYWGDGTDEAQLVYNFALPPLILHTLRTGDARALSAWAATLSLPSNRVTFFNFLASHDGIGLNPVSGILPQNDIEALVQQTLDHGGLISYKHNPDGSQSPYELNINYFDALSDPRSIEAGRIRIDRYMAAQAIMLSFIGLPGIYFHSLFGSRGWPDGVQQTGRHRTINRQKCLRADLESKLADPASLRHQIFTRYSTMLRARASAPAFHPHGTQQVVDCGERVFGLLRVSPDGQSRALALHNVSRQPCTVAVDLAGPFGSATGRLRDLLTGKPFNIRRKYGLRLSPYQILWLAP